MSNMKLENIFLEASPFDVSPVHSRDREHVEGYNQALDKKKYLIEKNLRWILETIEFEDVSDRNTKRSIMQTLRESIKLLNSP